MELYFFLRGIRHQIEMFETFMQTQMWPWVRKDVKTGKEFLTMFQGAYRDAGPFKCYVFPEPCLPEVLDMLGIVDQSQTWFTKKPGKQKGSFMSGYAIKPYQVAARKILKCKKIPKNIIADPAYPKISLFTTDEDGKQRIQPYRYIEHRGVNIIPIGIRKDVYGQTTDETGKEIEQEML